MKECDIKGGSKHNLILPTYFPGVKTPNPHHLRHWAEVIINWYISFRDVLRNVTGR